MLTQEQRLKLKSAGYSDTKINVFEARQAMKQVEQKQEEPTFLGKVARETIRPLANVATNVAQAADIVTGGTGDVQPFSGKYLGEVKGLGKLDVTKGFTPENIQVLKDSVKAGVDIGLLLGGGGGVGATAKTGIKEGVIQGIKQGAKTGSIIGGTSGLATGLEKDATLGSTLKNTAMGAGGGAVVGGALGAVTGVIPSPETLGKVATKTGEKLKNAGEKVYGTTLKKEEPVINALQNYEGTQKSLWGRVAKIVSGKEIPLTEGATKPVTEANTALRQGLAGTEWKLGVQAKQASKSIWNDIVDPALNSSKEKISMKTFLGEIKKEIVSNPDINRRKTLLSAFNKFASDNKKVGNFSLKKLQDYKVEWAKFIPESYSKSGKAISGSLNEIRAIAKKKASNLIFDKLGGDVKTAYIDYGNLQSIIESGKKGMDKLDSKTWSKQIWEAVIDKAVTPITTIGGQILYRTGEGLEFIGAKGAKTVGGVLGTQKVQAIKNITAKNITTTNKTIISPKSTTKLPKGKVAKTTETNLISEAKKYAEAGDNKYYYVRNVENKGGYIKGKPSKEGTGRFNQQYEPTGEYMNIVSKRGYDSALPNLKKGITEFKKPLIIETDLSPNWKKELSNKYGGLKRDELSQAIKNDGYDGIITMTKNGSGKLYPSEVVDLKVLKKANKK